MDLQRSRTIITSCPQRKPGWVHFCSPLHMKTTMSRSIWRDTHSIKEIVHLVHHPVLTVACSRFTEGHGRSLSKEKGTRIPFLTTTLHWFNNDYYEGLQTSATCVLSSWKKNKLSALCKMELTAADWKTMRFFESDGGTYPVIPPAL